MQYVTFASEKMFRFAEAVEAITHDNTPLDNVQDVRQYIEDTIKACQLSLRNLKERHE